MTKSDLNIAINKLENHSLCLVHDDNIIFHDGSGISPMMEFISKGINLKNFSAADIIVGKAVSMLFVKSGIVSVYGKVMSKKAYEYLISYGVEVKYGILVDTIINRNGNDICPMEKTVANINDFEDGYIALQHKLISLKNIIK